MSKRTRKRYQVKPVLSERQEEVIEKWAEFENVPFFIDQSDIYEILGLVEAGYGTYVDKKTKQEVKRSWMSYSFDVENTSTGEIIEIEDISQYQLSALFAYIKENYPSEEIHGKKIDAHNIGSNWQGIKVVMYKRMDNYNNPTLEIHPHSGNITSGVHKEEPTRKPAIVKKKKTLKGQKQPSVLRVFKDKIGLDNFEALQEFESLLCCAEDEDGNKNYFYCGEVLKDKGYSFKEQYLDGDALLECLIEGFPLEEVDDDIAVTLDSNLFDEGLD